MKSIDNWIIIKALNKHEDLAIKIIDDNVYISKVFYDNKGPIVCDDVITLDSEEVDILLDRIAKVMTKKTNSVYAFNELRSQDIYLKLIAYNKAFKEKDTLKLDLYDYVGVNESSYTSITISKDSARNLYKALLLYKKKVS